MTKRNEKWICFRNVITEENTYMLLKQPDQVLVNGVYMFFNGILTIRYFPFSKNITEFQIIGD